MLWLHDIVFYLFTAFICHEHGCPAIVYAPHHQLLISGGRKGEVCIFDIRQRQLRHTFQAHDVPIRCLAMDPEEEYFVTGSSEGDIKVQIPQTWLEIFTPLPPEKNCCLLLIFEDSVDEK